MPAEGVLDGRTIEFDSMGSEVSILVVGGRADSLIRARLRIEDLEQKWSRFRPDSELSRLNRAERARSVSSDTRHLIRWLIHAWRLTEGAFDPTLLGTLVDLGYATSRTNPCLSTDLRRCDPSGRPDLIVVDDANGQVELPPGTALDAGGLGKGLAADLVAQELLDDGAEGAMVDVGGDIRVAGRSPATDGAWTISIDWPGAHRTQYVRLADGGVATSSTLRRTWQRSDRTRHHLIDPIGLRPSDNGTTTASAIAGTAAGAEALTKPAFTRPQPVAFSLADRLGAAMSIEAGGERLDSAGWATFHPAVGADR